MVLRLVLPLVPIRCRARHSSDKKNPLVLQLWNPKSELNLSIPGFDSISDGPQGLLNFGGGRGLGTGVGAQRHLLFDQ